jgi:hypothetical protein
MTPRASHPSLRRLLLGHHSAHRRARVLRASLRAAAAVAVALLVAVLAGVVHPGGEPWAWVRTTLLVAALVVAIARAITVVRATSSGFDGFLEQLERRFPDVRSWLRNALEFERTPPVHGSRELAHAVSAETAERVARLPLDSTRPRVEPRRPAAMFAGVLVGIIALAAVSPQRTLRSWRTLIDPASAAPPVRLVVEPGSVKITPGAALTVRARVWGTPRHPGLERRDEPQIDAAAEGAGDDGARVWRFDLSQLTKEQTYRVHVGRVTSPEYQITLAGEPSAVSFDIEYHAPAYARLPVQHGSATRGDVSALQGTRARVVATFDRDLTGLDATLPGGHTEKWTAVTPRRWSGEVPVLADGEYELHATAEAGQARLRYRVSALLDAPPVLVVQTPAGDLDLPAGQQVPVSALAQDDLGLGRLRVEYRKDADSAWRAVPLADFPTHPREASVQTVWDASPLGLLPGQSATFRFELEDDNVLTGPGRARSAEFQLRFPGLAELYEHIDRQQTSARQALEQAAEQAKEVQKSLDQLARQPQQATPQQGKNFERTEELKNTFQRQQELGRKVDQAVDQLRQSLEQAAERQAYNEELMTKLREMSELMRQIQSPEFREALRKMQEALERMDRQQLEQNLPDWRAQNKEMLEQLKRAIEMLKQMKQEQLLEQLAKRAKELKEQQDALNREHGSKPSDSHDPKNAAEQSESLSRKQEEAAQQSEKLGDETRQLGQESTQPQDKPRLQQAAEKLQTGAAPKQHESAKSARSQRSQQAQQSGQAASQQLQEAADMLQQMSAEAQERRKQLDLAALRRSAQDLVSLQRSSEENLNAPPSSRKEQANRQSDLSDGVSRVTDSLSVLAQQQPFITPSLNQSLGQAINSLQESGRQLATGNPARGEQAGREGSQALNQAILELRMTESKMCNNPRSGGAKPGGSAGEMLGEMGQRQGQINEQTRSITQHLTEQMRLSVGDQARMRELSEQQRILREQVEQIQRDEELKHHMLGRLDQAQKEMKEVEEVLQRGDASGELVDKQQRILSRLLDAQRSVNRRDYDPQRESRPGEEIARASAPELPADLLRESDRLRLDLLKAESDRYPAQYRAYIEAYLRSLNQQRATPAR